MSAKNAFLIMNAYELTARGTGPPFRFVSDEMSYAELFYVHEVVDHAHPVLGSIPLIQVLQPVARKRVTAEAVPGFALPNLHTGLDAAHNASLRLAAVVAPAAGACICISCIRATEATVHPTGGDQTRLH